MKKLLLLTLILLLVTMIACSQIAQAIKLPYREKAPKYKAGKDYKGSIVVDGLKRTYLLHIHKGFNPAEQSALVLGFHGGGGSGKKFAKQTGFSKYADKEGFIAVYPDGIKHNWNDGRDTTDAYKAGVDDIKFIKTLIPALQGKLPIDSKRIYAAGVSNGGIFSHRLGCEMADVFAAIGTVVGPIATKLVPNCAPSEPISVVAIQGTADPGIPFKGGEITGFGDGGNVYSAENTMKLWAGKNGCTIPFTDTALPQKVNDDTSVRQITYTGCNGNTEVRYYIVEGMGHGWPPKETQTRRAGKTSKNIDATQVIWEFFKSHPKSGQAAVNLSQYKYGDYGESLTIDGRTRTYLLHIPQNYDGEKQYPLVVMLHGTLGTGEKISKQTGFSDYADLEEFIVVYPDAIGNWNDGRGTSESSTMNVDDVLFIKTLVNEISNKLPIDKSSIYASGVSSGGIMTYRLGCEAPELFAALAPVIANVAAPIAKSCRPPDSVAFVTINGIDDPLVPFNGGECCRTERGGGEGGEVISHEESIGIFARKNGCDLNFQKEVLPIKVKDGTSVEKQTYTSCQRNKDVVSYVIRGGGHAWPPNPPQAPRITGISSQNIDATQVIWEFFKTHSKI